MGQIKQVLYTVQQQQQQQQQLALDRNRKQLHRECLSLLHGTGAHNYQGTKRQIVADIGYCNLAHMPIPFQQTHIHSKPSIQHGTP
jgi:hypothetical protein